MLFILFDNSNTALSFRILRGGLFSSLRGEGGPLSAENETVAEAFWSVFFFSFFISLFYFCETARM